MKRNVGGIDRTIRVLAGIGLIAWGLVAGSWWGAIGLVPLLTGTIGFCPAYFPFKGSTRGTAANRT